uniref:Uncharacterized protein n=1 Tax=Opuntia streptacantha TaxID=393608 RepID=A0A7C8ZKW7_OPUST
MITKNPNNRRAQDLPSPRYEREDNIDFGRAGWGSVRKNSEVLYLKDDANHLKSLHHKNNNVSCIIEIATRKLKHLCLICINLRHSRPNFYLKDDANHLKAYTTKTTT